MTYTLRINDQYIKTSECDITDIVSKYIEGDTSTELIVCSDNKYRSIGPRLDLSVVSYQYTILELTGISVYNTVHDSVTILDIHSAGDYSDTTDVINNIPYTNMKELSLTYYRLTGTISQSFDAFISITVLDLSRNELTGVLSIYLESLQELYLDYNSIQSISDPFYSMSTLRILSMKYNRLRKNPTRLYSMHSLESIDLSGNPFHR